MAKNSSRIVAFIDLLGTKESHKVSSQNFERHLEVFVEILARNSLSLDPACVKIDHFSDCAFITVSDKFDEFYNFLNNIREELLLNNLYFKCGLAFSGGERLSENYVRSKLIRNLPDEAKEKVQKICNFKLIGKEVVPAFLVHEDFKGVGFYIDKEVSDCYEKLSVDSAFISDKAYFPIIPFKDIRFSGRLVNSISVESGSDEDSPQWPAEYGRRLSKYLKLKKTLISLTSNSKIVFQKPFNHSSEQHEIFEKILKATKRAYIKDKSYPKYYFSLVVSVINSSSFDYIWFDKEKEVWNGYPFVFKSLIIDSSYKDIFKKYERFELVLAYLLSAILISVDVRRSMVLDKLSKEEIKDEIEKQMIPSDFKSMGFIKVQSDHAAAYFLERENKEESLALLQETERRIIRKFIFLRGRSVAGELKNIPDFVLSPYHKSRVEIEYSNMSA